VTASIVAPIDHTALDAIMARLEQRYGFEPRLDRALRIVMGGRVEMSEAEPTTGLVHGDAGKSYWATVSGFCECPDAERVARCKHSFACLIAAQLEAVGKAKRAQAEEARKLYPKLCQDLQQYGRLLIAQGTRPIDDPAWRERDQNVQQVKAQLQPLSIR
jgi:hypothetical protein